MAPDRGRPEPMPAAAFLPYSRQCIDEADVDAVCEVLRGDWLTTGPAVERFERAFADRIGARHAVACSSGTAALHLAAIALGLGPGDRAVVPAVTFLAGANCVRYTGADVVFADVDPDTGSMTAETLVDAFARAGGPVQAVFPVHLNGHPVDMPAIRAAAARASAHLVEDACHALGAEYATSGDGRAAVGGCHDGEMAAFSLHAVKAVATGEGGLLSTNDDALAERLRRFRNHGMSRMPADFENAGLAFDGEGEPNPWYYEMGEPGFNYRLTDIQCALGLSQLAKLDRFLARRRELAARYDALLEGLAPSVRPVPRRPGAVSGWHLYPVLVEFDRVERAAVMRRLRSRGIGTQVHYIPVHLQPYYRRVYGELSLPGANEYYRRVLSLPFFPAMDDDDVDRVVAELSRALEIPGP